MDGCPPTTKPEPAPAGTDSVVAACNEAGGTFAKRMANTAIDALLAKGVKPDAIDTRLLSKMLKSRSDAALREGIADAKAAHEAGLPLYAVPTFLASAGKAGADAALAYLGA